MNIKILGIKKPTEKCRLDFYFFLELMVTPPKAPAASM